MHKKNPLNLNALQLKTLTLLQELARSPEHATAADEPGAIIVRNLPQPHGDHFHVGAAVASTADAGGQVRGDTRGRGPVRHGDHDLVGAPPSPRPGPSARR